MGSEEWISVLKLSSMWTFGELRQKAINWLGRLNIDPVQKVMLARIYKVESLLVDGYKDLARRKEGPSLEEAKALGYEAAIRLYEQRERHWSRESMPRSMQHHARFNLATAINNTFKEELDNIKRDSRVIEEASKPNGIENEPDDSTALMSDSDSDGEINHPSISSSRKRARR